MPVVVNMSFLQLVILGKLSESGCPGLEDEQDESNQL